MSLLRTTAAVALVAAGLALIGAQAFEHGANGERSTRFVLPSAKLFAPPPATSQSPVDPASGVAQPAALAETPAVVAAVPTRETSPVAAIPTKSSAPTRIALRDGDYLPISFDIGSPGGGGERIGDTIVTSKRVVAGGRDIGSMPIHVDGSARLLIAGDDLRRVLAAAGREATTSDLDGSALISFAELRKRGIDLRYEPNSDAVKLATP